MNSAIAFEQELREAATLWEGVKVLLGQWRSASPARSPRRPGHPVYDAWAGVGDRVRQHFMGPGSERTAHKFDDDDRVFLCRITNRGQDLDAVDAAAWGMDHATSHTFIPAWREELSVDVHRLADGELYPVPASPWDLTKLDELPLSMTSQPHALTRARSGELPSVRAHDASQFELTVDFSWEEPLEAILTKVDRVIAAQPNERWEELAHTATGYQALVAPADPAAQLAILEDLVRQALASDALVTVFPELCLSPGDAQKLKALAADKDQPRLIVVGSAHETSGGAVTNTAYGLVAGYEETLTHDKQVAFSVETQNTPVLKEGITEPELPSLRVWQADRFRLAMAICKEALDNDHARVYDRAGVNTLLVPALSPKTGAFGPMVQARVSGAQALTVVVNGPRHDRKGARIEPDVIIGQPIDGKESTLHVLDGPAPHITEIDLG